jgi:hypothetical protein
MSGPRRIDGVLGELGRLVGRIGSPDVDQCELCGKPADRMVCLACRAEREARYEQGLASADDAFRRVVRRAKELGYLPDTDRKWLESNGHKTTVEGLEERFRREADKRGGRANVRKRDTGAGFEPGGRR